MPPKLTTPPKQTVFDFIPYKDLERIAMSRVLVRMPGGALRNKALFTRFTPEDLFQEILTKLASANYDPEKSAPSTFIYMCADSRLGSLYKQNFKSFDRHKEIPEFDIGPGKSVSQHYKETAPYDVTPETYLMIKERINVGG